MLENGSVSVQDSTVSGGWTCANNSIATIDTSGLLRGIRTGITTITHTTDAGCFSEDKVRVITRAEAISLFPNPATHEIVIQQDMLLYSHYHVMNILGQAVLSGALRKGYNVIELEGLARGLYFVEVSDRNDKSIFKLLKE